MRMVQPNRVDVLVPWILTMFIGAAVFGMYTGHIEIIVLALTLSMVSSAPFALFYSFYKPEDKYVKIQKFVKKQLIVFTLNYCLVFLIAVYYDGLEIMYSFVIALPWLYFLVGLAIQYLFFTLPKTKEIND